MFYKGYEIVEVGGHVVVYKDGVEEFTDDTYQAACAEIDSIEREEGKNGRIG